MIVTYPNGLKNKGDSTALISHIDLYKSLAEFTGVELAQGEAVDSENVLPALLDAKESGRNEMLEESFTLSLRSGNWKYIAPFTGTTPDWLANKTAIENGLQTSPQLFDLTKDWQEQVNVAEQHPDMVEKLQHRIDTIKAMK